MLTSSCAAASGGSAISVSSPSSGAFRGTELSPPVALSGAASVPFTDADGTRTTLADLQVGHLMLVYFGYTHCPDVCPTMMADVAQALRASPPSVQRATRVVFVSSDPQRDTPRVLRAWLGNFDTGLPAPFIGLTGTLPDVDAAAKAVGVPLDPPTKNPDGTITVDHGAEMFAFQSGKAGLVWLGTTPVGDYTHDLAALSKGTA